MILTLPPRLHRWCTYRIRRGRHRSGFHLGYATRLSVRGYLVLTSAARYHLVGEDALDWNKLIGFADGWGHHRHSARLAWRCADGEHLELALYTYTAGVRQVVELGLVPLDTTLAFHLRADADRYVLDLDGHDQVSLPRARRTWLGGYLLWPYFGGNQQAPREVAVHLKLAGH